MPSTADVIEFPLDEAPRDREAEWDQWVSSLAETTRLVLTDPAADREHVYRRLFAARRISFGAILLELFAVEATWQGAEAA
jgi:hypothetical protein